MIGVSEAGGVALSVVIATYNREDLLVRLLEALALQKLSNGTFEVVVVDDGGAEEVAPRLAGLELPYPLRVERQVNAGAGAARHRGATLARGEVLLFIDDDMEPAPDLLQQHARIHAGTSRAVVLGHIRPSPMLERMPLFERFHAQMLDRFVARVREGEITPRGPDVCTGNVSMRRSDYFAVGGFDATLPRSEDAELGIRLEASGAVFRFSEEAYTIHGSDHALLEVWLKRAFLYGATEVRIAHKHPEALHANPWRFLGDVNPVSRPLLAGAVIAPGLARGASFVAAFASRSADALGLERVALAGTTLVYGLEYFRGMRSEVGTLGAAVREYRAFREQASTAKSANPNSPKSPADELVDAVNRDHETMRHYDGKYAGRADPGGLPKDVVQRIGLQILLAYRVMRWARAAEVPVAPKIVSRLIRHLYGSDIHWDAELAPGVMIVHGMGLAISHSARVAPGCILFQHVTIGESIDPITREVGAPSIEENVHIGPGATLLGPITIGAGSKIMAGAVVTTSVPPNSLVEPAVSSIRPRAGGKGGPATAAGAEGDARDPFGTRGKVSS